MKKWVGSIFWTGLIGIMTFFNFYRFIYEGPHKQFVYDSMDAQSWIIILIYSFFNNISKKKYTNPFLNAILVLNIGCCIEWFVKIYAADSTKKYSVDWPIAMIFFFLSIVWLIVELIITNNQTVSQWMHQIRRRKTK